MLAGFPKAPPPGRPGDPGLFGPGSAAWRINGEMALLLGGGRALLMQVAHPLVAAGVAAHSGFRADPYARLWATLDAMLTLTFGDSTQARAAAERVNAVHARVRGVTLEGEAYRALDPELLRWVHATIVDSALVAHERLVGPVPEALATRYHQEMKQVAGALRLPATRVPGTLGQLRAYVGASVAELEVSAEARAIGKEVLHPPVPLWLRPAAGAFRLITIELLPPRLRDGFGLSIPPVGRRSVQAVAAVSRAVIPLLPASVRRWPHARLAARRLAGRRR